jgi:hypothetical protein
MGFDKREVVAQNGEWFGVSATLAGSPTSTTIARGGVSGAARETTYSMRLVLRGALLLPRIYLGMAPSSAPATPSPSVHRMRRKLRAAELCVRRH